MSSTTASDDGKQWTFRVTGLGQKHTLMLSPLQTVAELQALIAKETGIPTVYQRILTPRGCKKQSEWTEGTTLQDAGLTDRTKLTLMHNALFAEEKVGWEALSKIETELLELENRKATLEKKALEELVTRICIQLDTIDTKGSEHLRGKRKELLRAAEQMDKASSTENESVATKS